MARYSKQTWDTTSIFNPTRMNHIEQGIYDADLREGGTIGGSLNINVPSPSTERGTSKITLGNNIPRGTVGNSKGSVALYSDEQYVSILTPHTYTADRIIYLPDKAGTIALTSDSLPLKNSDSSGVTSKTYEILSQTVYLMILGQSGGSGSMLLNASFYLISRPTNNGTDISYQPLVTGGRTITSATMSGNNATFNFSATTRSSIFQVATFS